MDGSNIWPWVQALHLVGTIILGGIIWAFQAGAKARAHDLPPQPTQDQTTRTAALMDLIRAECESLEQRSPKVPIAALHALEGKLKELQTDMREKHAYWRIQFDDQQDGLNAALRTLARLEERQEHIGKRVDEAWGQIDRRNPRRS